MSTIVSAVRTDTALRSSLVRLVSHPAPGKPDDPDTQPLECDAAEELFARIVWSRLVEPGDAAAGALISALGAAPLLDLIAARTSPHRICAAARDAASRNGGDFLAPDVAEAQVRAGIARWFPRLDRSATMADIDRAIRTDLQVVCPGDASWPSQVDDLGFHSPLLLWVKGDASHLSAASLAVVGARACSGYGTHVTADLTEAAANAGAVIVSGAAYGIDAVAHRTALAVMAPTIAVLAGGADRVYPASHAELLQRIAAIGVVCSEMVPGSAPTRWRFLQRNRVIAALGQATLVTEAGIRSGSLNTAGHSAELGRALGAVPGPVTSPSSAGCHRLIRDYDATLVTNRVELLELLGVTETALPDEIHMGDPPDTREPALHRRVLDALPLRGSRHTADVARIAGIARSTAVGALAELAALGAVVKLDESGASDTTWRLGQRRR